MIDLKTFTDEQLVIELSRRQNNFTGKSKHYHDLEEELLHLSKRLREAEKEKSGFLSNVRNEMNNPLTSILGLSESISQLTQDEKIAQLSRLIHREAFELEYQIRNIIAAAEIESGEIRILASCVDIRSLIESQICHLQPRIYPSHIILDHKKEIGSKLLFTTDAYLLQTIVVNLLANAVEFTQQKDKDVLVKAWTKENNLYVEVKDFGIGIDSEVQKRIFERFHQLDGGAAKLHKGQGLGLSIVIEFAEILGGTVNVESQANFGTSVTLQIPELKKESVLTGFSSFGNEIMFNQGEVF